MKICGLCLCLLVAASLVIGCGRGANDESGQTEADPAAKSKAAEVSNPPPPKCSSRSGSLAVTLDGEPGAENVGILMAEKRGFFADAGLTVGVAGPATPVRPVRYVATGVDAIGVTQQPQLVLAREEGVPVVSIGSVIRQPTAAIIWLRRSGIRDIADLEGKTIAVPGVPFQDDFLAAALKRVGLTLDDVDLERVNYRTVGALLRGKADAIFGAWNIEGAALQAQGADPVIKRVQSLGLPRYEELVVIAREECVRKHPDVMRRFMAAVARGTEAARQHRKEAANRIAVYHGFDREFTMKKLRRQLEVTLPLLATSARMDPARAKRLVAWMHKEGSIEREPAVGAILTNKFLAGSRD
jgi:putative hydroxymethylpyrimidine transport system substrate-binding protein